jgi:hypothetical protein
VRAAANLRPGVRRSIIIDLGELTEAGSVPIGNVATTISVKITAAVCVSVIALAACGHSRTDTNKAGPHTEQKIDAHSLIIGIDDVRRVAGENNLAPAPGPSPAEVHEPRHHDSKLPLPCQAVFDQEVAFDGNWKQFDSTTDSAAVYKGGGDTKIRLIANVTQAVAVYPDDAAAKNTFDQLKTKLTACPALGVKNYGYTIDDSDPSVLMLSTNVWTVVYRLKSAALINVAALGLNQPEPTARTLAQSISDRIQ